jgi:hypothetical protein
MDRFGFVAGGDSEGPRAARNAAAARRQAAWLENKRTRKWLAMYEGWPRWSRRKQGKIKSRVRKGIPDAMRGKMWMVISGADALRAASERGAGSPGSFEALARRSAGEFDAMQDLVADVEREEQAALRVWQADLEARAAERARRRESGGDGDKNSNSSNSGGGETKAAAAARPPGQDPQQLFSAKQRALRKWDLVVTADLNRTYPDHCMFHRGGFGQELLQRVLRAYGLAHPAFGYTQGMNFIAAMFLSYMPARDAYYMLTRVMDSPPWNLQRIFSDRTPMVPQLWFQFDALLRKYIPRVHAHFARENIMPSMYVTKWFVTLFTRDFGFDLVVRVWDIFLHQGWKVIHRVALALLKMHEAELLAMDMEKILYFVRELPTRNGGLDAQAVLVAAHKIPLRTKEVEALEEKWKKEQTG